MGLNKLVSGMDGAILLILSDSNRVVIAPIIGRFERESLQVLLIQNR